MKIKLYAFIVGPLLFSVLFFNGFSQVTNTSTSQSYTTIQAAINDPLTVDGNTLVVTSGTFNEEVTVSKQLNIRGANAGTSGTVTRAFESIIDGNGGVRGGFIITANNVTIDGFKIQNCGGTYGTAVYSAATSSGVKILNNVITGNVIGAYPQGTNVEVKFNLFDSNNLSGAAGGAGIYTEKTTDIIVEANEFKGHLNNSAVVFAATAADAHQNVTFTKNFIHNNNAGNSMVYSVAVNGGSFNNNTITQPGTTAIKFAGGCSNIDVSYNMLNNNGTGIKFGDDGYGLGENSAIGAHFNSLSNCTVAAIQNDNSFTANITCNWYGNISGPTVMANVGGTGASLAGTGNKTYANWLNYGTDASTAVGFQLPQNITVTPGGNNSIAVNHYRVLSNAIGCLVDNQNLTVSGTFNFSVPTAQAEWAKGNNQIAGDGQAVITGTGDDYSITVPQNVNGVTITASSLGSGVIQGPGDVASVALENPLYFNNNSANSSFKNWTISNLVFQGFDLSIACDLNGGNTTAFDNLKIVNNRFNIPVDLNATFGMETVNFQNIGLLLCFGANQEISGNTFNMDGTGASDDGNQKYSTTIAIQSATSGGSVYNGLKIKNNAFHVMGAPDGTAPAVIKGIWENGHNTAANIEVSGNTFVNDDVTNTAAINRQLAFWSTSFSSATTQVIYKENEVIGFNKGFASFGGEYSVYPNGADYNTGSTPVVLQNNKFDQNFIAVTARKSGISTNAGSPVYVAGNSFMNIPTGGFAVSNLSSGATELSCNWHGAATDYASIAASINGAYKITALLSNGTDANAATGFQPSPTATCFLPVHNVTQATNFFAIQEAIDAAAVGDSIHADGGIYKEVLAINKTLRFGGDAQGVIGTGVRPSLETQLLAPATTGVLVNLSGGVSPVFDGFKLTGNGIANVVQAGQSLTIKNSIAELSFLNGGNNLYFSGEQLNLFNNLFKATGGTNDFGNSSHIFVSSKITAKGNKFTSADASTSVMGSTTSLPVWMNITTNTTAALIDSNLFDNIDIGILVADNASNVNITNNEFTNANRANPTVNGYGTGIALFGNLTPTAPVNIKLNKFYNSQTGIRTSSGNASNNFPASNLTIAYNSFAGMTEKAIRIGTGYNSSTNKLNAKCNWFNSVTGPVSATNAGANGEPIMDGGAVNYKNWLIYGNDASTALGFQLPTAIPVAAGNNTSVAENQYRILSNAVGCAVEGQTLTLNGTFDWANSIAQAEWAKGNDGSATTTDDDYSILVTPNTNNVTVTAASLGSAIIQGPGDVAAANLEGVFYFDGSGSNKKWILSNLDIRNFDLSIGYFNGAGGTNAYDSFKIVNNHFAIPKDLNTTVAAADVNQNIGIHYSFGKAQEISGNTFEVEGDGVSNGTNYSTSVVMQSNTSGGTVYNGLQIKNNTITVTGVPDATNPAVIRGIWENGGNLNAAIEISGNIFTNANAANTADKNRQLAFWVTSKSGATNKVEYKNNEITGYREGIAWIGGDFTSYTPPAYEAAATPVEVMNNKLDKVLNGVVVRKATGSANTGSPAVIQYNSITNTLSGGLAIKNEGTGVTAATCNWYGVVGGGAIAALVSPNVTFSPYLLSGVDDAPATTGFQTSATCGVANDLFVNDNSQVGDVYTMAAGSDVTGSGTAAAPFATIQKAVAASVAGDSIYVDAGNYAVNTTVTLDKVLNIVGANANVSPVTGTRIPESVVDFTSNTAGLHFNITAPGIVTIKGFEMQDNLTLNTAVERNVISVNSTFAHLIRNNRFVRNATAGLNTSSPHAIITYGNSNAVIDSNLFTGSSTGIFNNASWRRAVYVTGGNTPVAVTNNKFQYIRSHINLDFNSNAIISGNDFQLDATGATALSLGGASGFTGTYVLGANNFAGAGTYINLSDVSVGFILDATASTDNGTLFPSLSLAQQFVLESKLINGNNSGKNGLVRTKPGNVYVIASGGSKKGQVQPAVDLALTGDIVNVADGIYNGDVNVNKSIVVRGQSQAAVLRGLYAGDPRSVRVSASNVTVKNVTITRNYGVSFNSNPGNDWVSSNKTEGIIIENVSNVTLDSALVTGNRNGVYVHSVPGFVIKNSIIRGNRTGFQIWGNLNDGKIINNFINNNFTHGLLINFDQGFTTGTNLLVNNNNISGNWYSQIDFQNNGAQGTNVGSFTGSNFNCNWYGTLFPDYAAVNAGGQGYADQTPAQFGGTDPNVNADIRGKEAALISYKPYLTNGTDSDGDSLNGFNPVAGACTQPGNKLYVNDNSPTGDVYTGTLGNDNNLGTIASPFATITRAIAGASAGDTIFVDAGTYREDVTVNKKLSIRGANYGTNPNAGAMMNAASTVQPGTFNPAPNGTFIFGIAPDAAGSRVDGFTLEGDNSTNGSGNDAAYGVVAIAPISNDTISNNIIRNVADIGIVLLGNGTATSGNSINNNKIENIQGARSIGMFMSQNAYASVTNNTMTGVKLGLHTNTYGSPDPGASATISNNQIESSEKGIWHNNHFGGASTFTISRNIVTTAAGATTNEGIVVMSIQSGVAANITDNKVIGAANGYDLWNNPTTSTITLTSDSAINCTTGVFANNYDGFSSNAAASTYITNGMVINGGTKGIYVKDNAANTNNAAVAVQIKGNTKLTGNTNGLVVEGGAASASFDATSGTPATFTSNTKYIQLTGTGADLASTGITATAVVFDTATGANTSLAGNFAIEDKIDHKIDLSLLGFVLVKVGNDYITPLSYVAPNTTPKIQRGVDAASTGFMVNVAAGTFADNVNIDKGLTINGADTTTTKVTSVTANGNIMTVAASNVTISNVHLEGSPDVDGNSATRGIYFNSVSNTDTIINVKASLHQVAVLVDNSANVSGIVVTNSSFGANGNGIGVGVSGKLNGLNISGSSFNSNVYGLSSNADPNGGNDLSMNNVTVTGTKFIGNTLKGMYFEKLSNASFSGNTFSNNGVGLSSGAGLDVNLKYGNYNAVSITGNTFTNNGNTASNGAAIAVKARNDAPNYSTTIATLSGTVGIANNEITTAPVGISLGYNVVRNGVAIEGNTIAGTGIGIVSYSAPANSVTNAHNNSIGSTVNTILNGDPSPISISANCNWHGNSDPTVVAGKIAGNVTYVPFLSSGADNSPSIGFQPAVPCTNTCTTLTTTITKVNNTCTGGSTGTITASNTAGGVGPYYYTLTNTANSAVAGTQDPAQPGKFTGLPAGTYVLTAFGSNGCSTSFAPVTITQPTGLAPDASISIANFTSNFFSGNNTSVTFLVQVQENAGNPITAATLNLTNQDEYTYSFPNIQQLTIRGTTYPIDNNHWTANFNPGGFTSSISLNSPNQVPCARSVYLAVTLTRNTPSKANFVVTSFMNNVAGELNTNNNSTTFLLVGN